MAVSQTSGSVAIDWSGTGQPEVGTNAQALAVAAGNPAHVSPFVEQRAAQPTMSVLQAMQPVQYKYYQPTVVAPRQPVTAGKHHTWQPKITQARGR